MSQRATAVTRARGPAPGVEATVPQAAGPSTPQAAPRIAPLLALVTREFELDAASTRVLVDTEPFRRRPTAAAAALHGDRIWLHPRLFDAAGRPRPQVHELLAHEAVHLVQHKRASAARAGSGAAELEARQIARRVAEGRRAPRVRLALPAAATAFDVGFDETVRLRYGAEIARIKRLLRGVWGFLWVTDGMVEEILTILQAMDYVSAVSLLAGASSTNDPADAITRSEREKLLDELGDSHRRRFRTQVLALYDALEEATLRQADRGLFAGMDLHHLRPEEHAALARAIGLLPAAEQQALRDDEEQGHAVALILGETSSWDAQAERTAAATRLAREAATRTAALESFGSDARLGVVFNQIREALRQGPSDRERLVMLDLLEPWMRAPEKLQAVALQLQSDTEGDLFEAWLDGFPVERLYQAPEGSDAAASGEHRLGVLLRLLEYRDAWRNAQLARELATQSWFLDIVNDEEAWLALQLITVLPPAMQERLLEELGPRIYENLSRSQREALGANFYRGGEGRRDLASIQNQLLDDSLWSIGQAGRLSGLIRMAIAAREHEWVFDLSKRQHDARPADYTDEDFQRRIVQPYQLYDPEARPEYRPEYLESVSAGAEVFEFFTHVPIVSGIFRGLAILGDLIAAAQSTREISLSGGEARGMNIARVQGLEHLLRFFEFTFYGVRFADHADLGAAGAQALEDEIGVNFIDRMRYRDGLFEMEADHLRIAAIRTPVGSLVIQGGAGQLVDLALRVSTGAAAPSMSVRVGSLRLADLLVVQTGGMTALNRIEVDGLDIRVGEDAAGSWLGTALFNAMATGLGPRSDTASLTAPDAPTPMELRFDAVRLMGLATSGGQYVDTLTLEGGTIGVSGDRAGYLRHLLASQAALTDRLAELAGQLAATGDSEEATRLEAEIARVEHQRDAVGALHRQITEAQSRVEAAQAREARGETLDATQRQHLEDDRALLARFEHGGAVVDLERVHITGVSGTLTMQDLDLADVHGVGTSSTALLGLMTSSDLLPRILQGERFEPEVLARGGSHRTDFELDLGTVDLRGVTLRSSIPTAEEAEAELNAARQRAAGRPWDRDARLAAELAQARFDDARTYAELAAIGLTRLRPAQVATMRAVYQRLSSREAFYAHHLHAEGAALALGDSGRTLGLHADRLDAYRAEDGSAGLRMGTYRIGEVHGTDVALDASVEHGLLGAPEDAPSLRERLRRIGLSGESLEILDFEDTAGDLSFDRAVLEGFDLRADREAGTTIGEGDAARTLSGTIDAQAVLARIEGLHNDVTEEGLLAQLASLEEKPESLRTDGDNQRLQAVRDALALFRGYVAAIEELEAAQRGAATAAERAEAESLLAATLQMFETWRRSVGVQTGEVHDLSVRVSGLGDVASADLEIDRALASGILVEGTGSSADGTRHDRLFSSAEVTDARFGADSARRVRGEEAAGGLFLSHDTVEFRQLALQRLELEGVSFEAGGNQVWSDHTTVATGLALTGSLHWEDSAAHPGDRYLARVVIDSLEIATIEGNGLNAYIAARQAMAQIESGVIGGLYASRLEIAMPENEDMVIHGEAGIRTLTDVRVNGMVEGALDYGRARLNGSDLRITFMGGLGERIYVEDLSLDEGDFRTPDGNVRITARHFTGSVEHEGTRWHFLDVRLPQLTMERLHWRSGARTFDAEQPATLSGLTVAATVDTAEAGNLSVHIDSLHADGLVGEHFRYEEPPLVVDVRQQAPWPGGTSDAAAFARPAIEIGSIDIADLDWTQRGGATAGTVDVASVHTALQVLRDDLDVGAIIDTGALHVGFRRDGVDVSVADIGVEASGTLASGLPVGAGSTIHAGISGANTGLMRFYDDRIELPALYVERLDLHQFEFQNPDYRLSVPETGGQVQADRVSANVTVELDPEAESMTPTRIVIHTLDVPALSAAGLEFTMFHVAIGAGTHDITIRLPAAPAATATDLHVGSAEEGGEGFVLTPHTDAMGQSSWLAEGALGVTSIDAVGLGVEIQDLLTLQTDAHVDGFTFGMLASGEWSLDVRQIDLTRLTADAAQHHLEIIGLPEHVGELMSGAPGLSLSGLAGSGAPTPAGTSVRDVSLESAAVGGLVYRNSDLGFTMEIASAQLPQGFDLPSGGAFTLPELQIDSAWFRFDDLNRMLETPAEDADTSGPATPGLKNLHFLDALHGTASMTVTLVDPLPDFDVTLDIRDGIIDLNEFENDTGGYDGVVDFDHDAGTLVLNIDWGNLVPIAWPLPALAPQANYAAATWTGLNTEEQALAAGDKARLSTLISQRVPAPGPAGAPDPDPYLQLHDIVADLAIAETEIELTQDAGTLVLGGGGHEGVEGLRVRGDIPSQLQIEIDRVGVSLRPGETLNYGGTHIGLGSLVIEQISNTTLDFTGFTPGALEGLIGSARAEDITVE